MTPDDRIEPRSIPHEQGRVPAKELDAEAVTSNSSATKNVMHS